VQECAAYLDASGKNEGYSALCVAGLAAPIKKWIRFESQWKAALERQGVQVFHMTDFAASKKEFKGWHGDTERRGRFIAELLEITKRNVNKLLVATIEIDAWNAGEPKSLPRRTLQ